MGQTNGNPGSSNLKILKRCMDQRKLQKGTWRTNKNLQEQDKNTKGVWIINNLLLLYIIIIN